MRGLFAAAEAPRPPSGLAWRGSLGCGSLGLCRSGGAAPARAGCEPTARCAAASGCGLVKKLTFSRTVERRRAAARSASWAASRLRPRRCDRFRLCALLRLQAAAAARQVRARPARRRLGRTAVEIGDRLACFRRRWRSEFVGDRSGKTVFRAAATPAASATTSAAARAPLAVRALFGAGQARLFVGLRPLRFRLRRQRRLQPSRREARTASPSSRGASRLHALRRRGRAGAGAACADGHRPRLRRRLPRRAASSVSPSVSSVSTSASISNGSSSS